MLLFSKKVLTSLSFPRCILPKPPALRPSVALVEGEKEERRKGGKEEIQYFFFHPRRASHSNRHLRLWRTRRRRAPFASQINTFFYFSRALDSNSNFSRFGCSSSHSLEPSRALGPSSRLSTHNRYEDSQRLHRYLGSG